MQIAAELEKVGIKVNITRFCPGPNSVEKMYADPVEGYDMILHGWGADYNDSSNIISLCGDFRSGRRPEPFRLHRSPNSNEYYQSALHSPSYEEAGEILLQGCSEAQ